MADNRVRVNHVKSCNLGKLGSDGVALKINFIMSAGKGKAGQNQSAVFGLSHQLAVGLAKALIDVLKKTQTPSPTKAVQ